VTVTVTTSVTVGIAVAFALADGYGTPEMEWKDRVKAKGRIACEKEEKRVQCTNPISTVKGSAKMADRVITTRKEGS
jgi:hypothetical protein